MQTADADYLDALSDLGPDELRVVRTSLLSMRDRYAGGDRIYRALAAAFALTLGIAADTGSAHRDELRGIEKATHRHVPA
jgi:hypothetical protein